MSRSPLLKVYGHVYPVCDDFFADLAQACASALPDDAAEPVLERERDLARFSFEGVYFPVEETLAVVTRHLRSEHKGKLDVLDLENWRLIRHVFAEGKIRVSAAPLNNVLDYSGH
ncbi:hypothetical protein [Desulfovibrio sp. ZJ200]|uniref:hypothetical protein n=1 Tax=Desulfovibrio sp. ZJ200 TaxID=2709792 RepID=UPI0013E9A9CF|nr:hypothetical protein [Desulfovibrio sp. ZJ200]